MSFKEGDRVRHVGVGTTGTVEEVDGDSIRIQLEDGRRPTWLSQRVFELVVEPEATTDPVLAYLDRLKISEVRVKDAGGSEKGQKSSQIAAMDPLALLYLGEVSGMGAAKYAAFNYLQSGYDWRLSMDAALRHLMAFWAGQDADSESELLHVAHAAWHCLALVSFQLREIGTDTRFKQDLGDAA